MTGLFKKENRFSGGSAILIASLSLLIWTRSLYKLQKYRDEITFGGGHLTFGLPIWKNSIQRCILNKVHQSLCLHEMNSSDMSLHVDYLSFEGEGGGWVCCVCLFEERFCWMPAGVYKYSTFCSDGTYKRFLRKGISTHPNDHNFARYKHSKDGQDGYFFWEICQSSWH